MRISKQPLADVERLRLVQVWLARVVVSAQDAPRRVATLARKAAWRGAQELSARLR